MNRSSSNVMFHYSPKRVIPGSHMKRHPLHDMAAPMHTDELRAYDNPDHIQFQHADGEIDVPVKAGDLVVGYANIFHAAHANQTNERLTVLTMWYYPDFVNLPERTQATVEYLERRKPYPSRNAAGWN